MSVYIEKELNRIVARFPYSPNDVGAMRNVPGRRWDDRRKVWSLPLDMSVCRLLRRLYGQRLQVGPELRSWAVEAKRAEERLGSISAASSGVLRRLPHVLPKLHRALYLGPLAKQFQETDEMRTALGAIEILSAPWDPERGSYQTADVRFLADATAPANFNHQGLGKTLEAIAEVWESGRHIGDHLVICPAGAVETVWLPELVKWQADAPCDVMIFPCVGPRSERQAMLEEFSESKAPVNWVIVNPEMVRWEKDKTNSSHTAIKAKPKEYHEACKCGRLVDAHWHYQTKFPILSDHTWRTIINDEVHVGNVRNPKTITAKSVYALPYKGKLTAMSGTPMKKKGADLWGILHYLRPDVFTSYWNFAEMFFDVTENDFGYKVVGGLRKDRQEEFFQYLTPYVLRRTKEECLKWLPPKHHIDVWVTLEGDQFAQYQMMEQEAIATLGKANVTATNTLSQFTRLQQFANAYCELVDDEVKPTLKSAKLDALFDRLTEAGILDGSSDDQTVIFSQSKRMIDLLYETLKGKGVAVGRIAGDNVKNRGPLVKAFQRGDLKVLCVVTTAGGVALTLDAADTAHFIDEMWAPDAQEQAEDRLHRASRIHQVTIYHYRARDTIDELKMQVAEDKHSAHEYILDVRRKLLDGSL